MRKLFVCLTAFIATAAGVAAEIPPAEKLLPADTLGVLAVPDFAKAREIYAHSPQGQLWRDPAMKAFVSKFTEKLNTELIAPLEKDLGTSLTNYTSLLQGQLTLAFVQNGWSGGEELPQPGWLLILDTKDKSDLLKSNLAELKHKWTDANKSSRTEKIRDVEFTVLRLSTNDVPPTLQKLFPGQSPAFTPDAETPTDKNVGTVELFIGQSDSLLIAGNQTNVLEKILIAQSGGTAPTLGEQATFEANRLALFRNAMFYGWVNAKAITDTITKQLTKKADEQADKPSFSPIRPEKIIGSLGLDSIKSIAFSVQNTDEGSFGNLFVTAPESERHGLLSLIVGANKETLPPEFIPADAIKFQRLRLDGKKTWDNLERTLGNLSPQLLSGLNFALDMAGGMAKEKNPDYDLKKSLLDSIGDDVITYEKAPRSSEVADLVTPPSITLIGTTKPDQLIEAAKYLLTATNQRGHQPKDREFNGRKIYSIDLPPIQLASGKTGPERSLSFSAANGYLAVSTDTALLEEFLRSSEHPPAKLLRESAGLLSAIVKLKGTRPSCFTYENQAETMRAFINGLKQNFADKSTAKSADAEASADFGVPNRQKLIKEWADVSLLPDFDKIAKYFYLTVGAGSASPEGISFKVFSPNPPQLQN